MTGNIILRDDEPMPGPFRELHQRGVGIALDDYGAGYASLSMLKRYPLSRLKIDQAFVSAMLALPPDAAIIGPPPLASRGRDNPTVKPSPAR